MDSAVSEKMQQMRLALTARRYGVVSSE